MKQTILLIMVALIVLSVPAMAGRVVNKPLEHPCFEVYQAYCGNTCIDAGNQVFQGLNGFGSDVIKAVPGVLVICPGGTDPKNGWPNYVTASQTGGPTPNTDGTIWTVTNVSMRKTVPTYVCTIAIGGAAVLQQGSANIRLWWPLMYELPGTKWTLTISYKTNPWDDDGTGPNLAATTHQDVWCWEVDATLASMGNLIDLFHELPVGSCQVPLVNGKDLYEELEEGIATLEGMDPSNPEMAEVFNSFILLIEDSCLTVECGSCSSDLGIRNTSENPACCKLLADADFIINKLDVNIPGK
jgi:hypothetical protein